MKGRFTTPPVALPTRVFNIADIFFARRSAFSVRPIGKYKQTRSNGKCNVPHGKCYFYIGQLLFWVGIILINVVEIEAL